ncbi:FtsW/RodA/SpoVE family cell cycle protein [Anaerotardibacter muris]|uniref:FtsW/RodA/SpoVE family cell cycle protein n=1 Tax=Anaerotardibacter muris TaxID=2941505 RepID=UPI00204070D8|nr:FtsW/RodA/SpoVE family cell cycle protein [Anaerotardibacter muris]
MTRRNIELALLCIAAPLAILLFAMIALNQGEELGWASLGVPVGIFASFIVAHLAIRKFAPGADPAILPISFALSSIGIAFVTRLAPDLAIRQVGWLFLGIVFMVLVIVFMRNMDRTANYKYTLMIIGLILLLSPLLPGIGREIYGSKIWLSIGGFSFQPGEIAKIFIVLFLAAYLAQNREMLSVFTHKIGPFKFPDLPTILPLLIMWLISMAIVVFEKDLGSALIVYFVFLTMLYVASGKKFYLIVGLVTIAIGAVILFLFFSHVQVRVDTWLDPFADPTDTGYQLVQSIFSMADGGLFGVGIGSGLADNIPIVESDFIFAAIAEETGLLGAAGVLLLYLCFAIRGLVTAARAKSDVSSFIAVGLTATIVLQAFIIVGGVTRLIPLTGLTLPFVSQGGSSLLASFIAVGFLLKCGDQSTGLNSEIAQGTGGIPSEGVLGRVSLGKRITNTMIAFSVMFALLVANLTMIMVVQADEYKNMPINNHTLVKESKTERGTISTYDNVVLAQSIEQPDGTYKRVYPAGTLAAHIVGYASEKYGTAGIESSYNDTLKGERNYASWTDVLNATTGNNAAGNDVKLTINSTIQKAAQEALEGFSGACVVIDPKTGAVLALASSPTYNAGDIEELLQNSSNAADSSALYNRATQALYPPGSTFKIVTLTGALENNVATESSVFSAPSSIEIGNGDITNFHDRSYGEITLARATELSANTVYAQVGERMGSKMLVEAAHDFGFNQDVKFDLPLVESLMPNPDEMTTWETAWAAAGEPVGEHESPAGPQTSVLEMAMVGCAITNNGVIQKPYLVDSIYNAEGKCSFTAQPSTLMTATNSAIANRVKTILEGVVASGTGTAAAVPGVTIAGKTGTAETGKAIDDSWFVGMGPSNNCNVVVAIVLEEGADLPGGAASRARGVLQAALQVQGVIK